MSNSPRIEKLDNQLVINGDMNYAQRGITDTVTGVGGNYLIDRFRWATNLSGDIGTIEQVSDNNKKWAKFTATSTTASGSYADAFWLRHAIEGTFIKDNFIKRDPMKLQFRVKSNVTGRHEGYFSTYASDTGYDSRVMPFSYTINQANTEEVKVISFEFDTFHRTDTSLGIDISFIAYSDGGLAGATEGVWQAFSGALSASPVNILTSGNYIQITEMMVYSASALQGPQEFRLAGRNAVEEFRLCQRYYETSGGVTTLISLPNGPSRTNATYAREFIPFTVEKRTLPILTESQISVVTSSWIQSAASVQTNKGFLAQIYAPSSTIDYGNLDEFWAADAEL